MPNYGFSVDTAANWAANNPTPLLDEECLESDTGLRKLGDGTTAYNTLDYLGGQRWVGVASPLTAAGSLLAQRAYRVNLAASLGGVQFTLPTAPPQSTVVVVNRTDNNTFTSFCQVVPGGTDTIDGVSTTLYSVSGSTVLFLYLGTNWTTIAGWKGATSGLIGPTSSSVFGNSLMSRDGNSRVQVGDPAAQQDAGTKKYIDTADTNAPTYGVTSGALLSNRFDKLRGVYNLKSSNTRRTDIGLGRCQQGGMSEHVWIGDSASAGTVSAIGVNLFDRLNAVPMAFRNGLDRAGIPSNGTGFVRVVDSPTFQDSRWVATGTWTNFGPFAYSSTAGSLATFFPDKSGTFLDVGYYDATGGATFTIAVDGTTVATVNSALGTNAPTGAGWKIYRVANVNIVGGQSKVVVTVSAGGGTFYLSGAEVWTPNSGLRVHNLSQSGSRAFTTASNGAITWQDTSATTTLGSTFTTGGPGGILPLGGWMRQVTDAASTVGSNVLTSATGAFTNADLGKPIDHIVGGAGQMFPINAYISAISSATAVQVSYLVNNTPTAANAYSTLTAQTVNIGRPPDAVHIELGGNDLNNGTTAVNVIAAITAIRNRYPNTDCFLHLPQEFATSYVSAATTLDYQQRMYALADTLDVPLYDWRDQIGTFANGYALGWYGDNAVHLTSAAQVMIGSGLSAVLGPGSGVRSISGQQQPYRVVPVLAGLTATFTAAPWTWNRCDGASAMTCTLPLTPYDGTEVTVEHTGAVNTVSVLRNAAPDTIEGSTAATVLSPGERCKFTYRAATSTWYQERELWNPTAGTGMRRDVSGRSQVADPAAAQDIATKNYVDGVNLAANLAGTAVTSSTTDTKILSLSIPANTVAVGDTFKFSMHGISSSTGTLVVKAKVGTTGTASDATAWISATSVAQVTNQRAGVIDGLVQVRSTGAGGTVEAEALGYAGTVLLPTVVAAAATTTAVTTGTWFITLTVSCSVGTFTAQSATIRKG